MNAGAIPGTVQHLARPEGRIAYDRIGEGPLMILAPGMGDLRQAYRLVAPALAEAGWTVVTTDLRGHGDSDTGFSEYGDEPTADDLVALIEHLGGPALVVGNSMSAGSAVIAAARRPDLVSGLALLGPFVRDGAVNPMMRALMRVMLAPPWIAAVWKAYMPSLYAGARPTDFDAYRDTVAASLRRPGYRAAFSATSRTSHAPAEAALPKVQAPTLVIMGEQDPDFPDVRAEAEWIASQVGGKTAMIADAGHYPQSQQPVATLAALLPFAEKVRGDAESRA
ncbi:alpha/beta fold hydrolase [Demequina zhanjiangensis]|uniref:Alpha/beta hydrolase n=1 Tax=Demequina zhanjiangensis TaxID=3051659 RepID=A0ABT8G2M8_9MICO|nr:alpha/beta hydrolase [Demequina sp. SYSU T00b26]MDN4473402.1 alpha/beta hydrolase [Demequina sp. SYSU T00b26]